MCHLIVFSCSPVPLFIPIGCCCDGSPLLGLETNGVIGKNVTFKTTITTLTDFVTIAWTFKGDVPIVTHIPSVNKVTIDDRYKSRVIYNETTCALVLKDLVTEDGGAYGLTIVTSEGKQLAGDVLLKVLGKCVPGVLLVVYCVMGSKPLECILLMRCCFGYKCTVCQMRKCFHLYNWLVLTWMLEDLS